ncbi:MAG: hypothetical protein H7256_13010 [Bdellovibrio sp.]|nr:hypothetical protein [Bdellovibrio sp.]
MRHHLLKLFCISLFTSYSFVFANELHLTQEQALQMGFKKSNIIRQNSLQGLDLPAHALPWPVQFVDSKHTIGNSMPEYQNYGDEAYYHEGSDLRVSPKGEVKAPADGFLQANYYSYVTDQQTGQDQKYTKPISEGGDDLYFEVTIKTTEGFQFEFHHVNAQTLPKNIYDLAIQGGGPITKGQTIGFASLWPMSRMGARYDHIHYNLISPSGVYMNTEYYSQELGDQSAPIVKNIFAIYKNKKIEVLNQKLGSVPNELVISAYDMKGTNVYPLPPTLVEASWGSDNKIGWNFTQNLLTPAGTFPDLREVYARNLRLDDGRSFTTLGDYDSTLFLFRLKLPATATLPITLTIQDATGNQTKIILN